MEMRKVKLVENHTHEGIQYYPGQTIDLPKEDAEWLLSVTAAERVSVAKSNKEFIEKIS